MSPNPRYLAGTQRPLPTTPTQPVGRNFIKPQSLVRGTVIQAFQALGLYNVISDRKQFWAVYAGSSRGKLGTSEGGGFQPGQTVWVTIDFDALSGYGTNYIIGAASSPAPITSKTVKRISTYPQSAGVEFDYNGGGYGKRLNASYASEFPNTILDYGNGPEDSQNGDWTQTNFFGGGVGVEPFTVWVKASPSAGIQFYLDDDLTRIIGENYELITMAEEYEDRIYGGTTASTSKRVRYPSDALYNNQYQRLVVDGHIYRGEQQIVTYRSEDNLDGSESDKSELPNRFALIHEYRGMDGNYALSAAGSLVLRKFFGFKVPYEKRESGGKIAVSRFPQISQNANVETTADPFDEPKFDAPRIFPDKEEIKSAAINPLFFSDKSESVDSLLRAVYATGPILDYILNTQTKDGFNNMSKLWEYRKNPTWLTEDEEKPSARLDAAQWKSLPKSVFLNLSPYGGNARYFLGQAIIELTHDGGIILEDAYGSRITMSGGNIVLSAEHDIILHAGRNITGMSGHDIGVKAGRHIELAAVEGDAILGSGHTTSIVGGSGGSGGVVVESLGAYHASSAQDGATPVLSGGIVFKANSAVQTISGQIIMRATGLGHQSKDSSGTIIMDTDDGILWRSRKDESNGVMGATLSAQFRSTVISLGGETNIIQGSLAVLGDFRYGARQVALLTKNAYDYYCDQVKLEQARHVRNMLPINSASILSQSFVAKYYAYRTSTAEQSDANGNSYSIPLAGWQLAHGDPGGQDINVPLFVFTPNSTNNSYPFPRSPSTGFVSGFWDLEYYAPAKGV